MYIKSVKISGFKNVPETETRQYDFFDFTRILGENYSGKTSIGDALCWVFTGRSSTGISSDYVLRNNESRNAFVEVEFTGNAGEMNKLKREMSGTNHAVYLNDIPVKESELSKFIGTPEIFLSTFMIGYFHRLTPKAAKELLMSIIPFPSHASIMNRVEADLRHYLPQNEDVRKGITSIAQLRQYPSITP